MVEIDFQWAQARWHFDRIGAVYLRRYFALVTNNACDDPLSYSISGRFPHSAMISTMTSLRLMSCGCLSDAASTLSRLLYAVQPDREQGQAYATSLPRELRAFKIKELTLVYQFDTFIAELCSPQVSMRSQDLDD